MHISFSVGAATIIIIIISGFFGPPVVRAAAAKIVRWRDCAAAAAAHRVVCERERERKREKVRSTGDGGARGVFRLVPANHPRHRCMQQVIVFGTHLGLSRSAAGLLSLSLSLALSLFRTRACHRRRSLSPFSRLSAASPYLFSFPLYFLSFRSEAPLALPPGTPFYFLSLSLSTGRAAFFFSLLSLSDRPFAKGRKTAVEALSTRMREPAISRTLRLLLFLFLPPFLAPPVYTRPVFVHSFSAYIVPHDGVQPALLYTRTISH